LLSKNIKIKIYRGVILHVPYRCETWSVTLKLEHRLRVFVIVVLEKILGSKRDDVAGGWRKLYQEELHDPYSSPNIIRVIKSRRMRWAAM